jgi:hypothetical protein
MLHFAQAHFFADELREFFRRNFAETFEGGDVWLVATSQEQTLPFPGAAFHKGLHT